MLVTYTSLHFWCWCTIFLPHFCPGFAGHARWCKGQGLEGLLQWGWWFRNPGHGWGVAKQQCPPNILYLLNIDGWKLIHFLSKWSLFRGKNSFNFGGCKSWFRSEANNLSCFFFVVVFFREFVMGLSENSGTPKSSILIGFSIINHPFWGTFIFGLMDVHASFLGGWEWDFLWRLKLTEPFGALEDSVI